MSVIGQGCVKTQNGTCSQNIGLPKRAVFDYFWLGIGRKTPEFEIALSFYTASADSRRVGKRPKADMRDNSKFARFSAASTLRIARTRFRGRGTKADISPKNGL